GHSKPLVSLDLWSLLNLRADDVLALPDRLESDGIERNIVSKALEKYSLQNLGLQAFSRKFLSDLPNAPVFLVPGTKHYSFPKAAALLGIGADNMIDIAVDRDARMSMTALRAKLQDCVSYRKPVLTVVSVIGTTEESAVDPIKEVLAIRDEFR